MKTSGSESRPRKVELASAHKNTMSTMSILHSLAWPDRCFPFFFVTAQKNGKPVVTKKNGKKRSGQARLYFTHNNEACKKCYKTIEGYQCQKSTLRNKRSNKKECGINKKECGILQALA